MKTFTNKSICTILLCVIFCFGWSTQKKVVPVAKPIVETLREFAKDCSKETGVPADTLKKILDWSIPNDLPHKTFTFCITTRSGFADENGHMSVEKVGALKPEDGNHEQFIQDIKVCNEITKENIVETIYAMGECITNKYAFKVLN